MLVIYGALPLGGVETFFARLFEAYLAETGSRAKLLLVEDKVESNEELLKRVAVVADVYSRSDVFRGKGAIAKRTSLLSLLNDNVLSGLMEGVTQIHVASGHHALLATRLVEATARKIPITVGFYHSLEFAWGGRQLPYFERINRNFVLQHLPKSNLFLFSKSIVLFYSRVLGVDLQSAKDFRLGVLNEVVPYWRARAGSELRIVSVGRLVHFKAYNLWMLDVVSELVKQGVEVKYFIYGSGPLEPEMIERCDQLGIRDSVSFCGNLDYARFNKLVLDSDIFVGSGTAVIQAASLGVPSIVGIESEKEPVSYGFFHQCANIDYNINEERLPLSPVVQIINSYLQMSNAERKRLSEAQVVSCEQFLMHRCLTGFNGEVQVPDTSFKYGRLRYVLSYISTLLRCKLKGESFYKIKRTLANG